MFEHNILVVDIDRVHCFPVPVPVPSAPTITMAVSQSPTSINVSWTQSEGEVVDSYEVSFSFQRSCDEFNHTNTTTVAGTIRQYTLTGLQEFSNYTVTVVAENGAGRSGESSENVVTMADGMSVYTKTFNTYCIMQNFEALQNIFFIFHCTLSLN